MIELARESLVMRGRDLDGIMYGNPHDVRWIDAGDGLSLACIGLSPEHRALVESIYVFLQMKNGVPIGYFQAALLFGSAEVNYHVFPSFRGVEAADVYARSLGVVRHLFGTNAFSIHPYQLGHGNDDALAAGAFWFYAKLGFRPERPKLLALLKQEQRAIARNPRHRTRRSVLRQLASDYAFFYTGRQRDDVAGKVELSRIPLALSRVLSERFGSDRERGLEVLARDAARLLGARAAGSSRDERRAWQWWAPLVFALPGVERWSLAERRALAGVIAAKGAHREDDFVRRLDRHLRLRRALLQLARTS